jgi:phosphatidylserine/phosphatidylglycerophosphate/cardiolipin synthase-like enzyme
VGPRNLFASLGLLLVTVGGSACGNSAADTGDAGQSGAPDAGAGGDAGSSDLTLIVEPDQGMTPIYDLIGSAKQTLDITMYDWTDTKATGLLTAAAKSGVKVRVILDQNLEMMTNTAAYDALGAGGVQVHWADPTYAATHQKTITVDGTTSAIMTLNFSLYDYPTSRDFAVLTTESVNVAAIEQAFGEDFVNNATMAAPNGDGLVWSPSNSQASLVDVINGAKASLLVENEEMSNATIIAALGAAASRGVVVEVVMTASKSWDTSFTTLAAAGVKVVTYARNASLYIHAKAILADYGTTTGHVFIGSENFSYASLNDNRELGLITEDPAILASMNATLTKDFSGGTPYP